MVIADHEEIAEVARDADGLDEMAVAFPASARRYVEALSNAPTLIITWRQDNICGYRDALEVLDLYPRASLAALDRAGHLLRGEQEPLFIALVNEWLDRVEESISDTGPA
jgi:pimeloyl-ACP methyl ester carboxylesterase